MVSMSVVLLPPLLLLLLVVPPLSKNEAIAAGEGWEKISVICSAAAVEATCAVSVIVVVVVAVVVAAPNRRIRNNNTMAFSEFPVTCSDFSHAQQLDPLFVFHKPSSLRPLMPGPTSNMKESSMTVIDPGGAPTTSAHRSTNVLSRLVLLRVGFSLLP